MSHPIESIRLQVREIVKQLIAMGLSPIQIARLLSEEASNGMVEAGKGLEWLANGGGNG